MEPTLQEGQYIIVNRLAYLNFAYEHLEDAAAVCPFP